MDFGLWCNQKTLWNYNSELLPVGIIVLKIICLLENNHWK
jgi:hypothetical protein